MDDTKIAFFIQLKNLQETLTNSNIEEGNPGVGGTQYLFLLAVKYLNKTYGTGYAVMLSDADLDIDEDVAVKDVTNEKTALKYCENNNIENIVFNANIADRVNKDFFDTKIRILLWAHNTLSAKRQRIAARMESIYKVVCVSESQYLNMRDTECFDKCTFINNIIPETFYNRATASDYSKKQAVYIGSATPQKGIHNLLKIWRIVERKDLESELYVIGGAKVWNEQNETGLLGVGDKYYDRILYRKLKKIKYPERIHFLGSKSWEEIKELIPSFRVGIVNPSHYMRDETFCMSAIEMQAYSLPVVSRKRNDGIATTIKTGYNGFLERNDRKLAERILGIMNDKKLCCDMGKHARAYAKQFIVENEITKWDKIIENLCIQKCKRKILPSKDSIMLFKDSFLKLIYIIASGKIFKFIRR